MNAIEIVGLTKMFGSRTAVDALNLSVLRGETFALLGQNGAGKTTTLRMLAGLLPPSGGAARIMGHDVGEESLAAKQLLNVSPQETAVAPKLSVRENLELMARLYGKNRRQGANRVETLLQEFRLTERAKDRAKSLSGGMQRRLSIAMALVSEPQVLFLDEPTLGLDVRARRDLWTQIERLKGRITVILTTHYLEEAEALADRIGIMSRGRMQVVGTVEEIKRETGAATLEDAFLTLTDEEVPA